MSIDVKALADDGLDNLIESHRRHGATDQPIYLEALAERMRRRGRGLEFGKSFRIIARAAKERKSLSYKDLADASEAEWTQVHYSVGGHLFALVEYAYRMGWPMLSAIVVNKGNVKTGAMEPETIKGFIAAAHELGHVVTDEKEFLKDQQRRVFEWAASLSEDQIDSLEQRPKG